MDADATRELMLTSFGQVMILGNWSLRSFWPLTIASRIDGWSDPRFAKTCVMPACSCQYGQSRQLNSQMHVLYLPERLKEGERSCIDPI